MMNNEDLININKLEKDVMCELKDFQQATVNRIAELYEQGQNRILVSDEVGLGKTLIARGVIAKFIKLRKLKEKDNIVKVVYICSNAAIAQQNLNKLNIGDFDLGDTHTSRLSMQHLNIFNTEYKKNKWDDEVEEDKENVRQDHVQLISLTPQTSFKITNSQGLVEERALMYTILKHMEGLEAYDKELSEFLRYGVKNGWDYLTKVVYDIKVNSCNDKSGGVYLNYMKSRLGDSKINGRKLKTRLRDYLEKGNFKKDKEARDLIIELRKIFAKISLERLDPDLIIMDEFQRFKYLLDSDKDSDIGVLTEKFFNPNNISDTNDDVRILLLSATPYKMYSTLDEINEAQVDEHYKEFLDVINFLNPSDDDENNFKTIWSDYSLKLKEISKDRNSFILAKNNAENALYKNVCRTERIAETHAGVMIDDSDKESLLGISKEDITSYKNFVELLRSIPIDITSVPVDYIKSSPYLMSFMKNYQLKTKIQEYFGKNPEEIYKLDQNTFWINKFDIDNYKEIHFNHARFNHLINSVFKGKAEKLLWVPPSKEYYPSEGVFKGVENFSKTLIFSSWEMVPRMISTLISYEAERKTIGELSKNNSDIKYFKEEHNRSYIYTSPRINYSVEKGGKPKQMTLMSLIYPSKYLSMVYDPIEYLNHKCSLRKIEDSLKKRIQSKLDLFGDELDPHDKYKNNYPRGDNRWYYIAPLLLDCLNEKLESQHEESNLEWYDYTDYVDNWFKEFKESLQKQNGNDKLFNEYLEEQNQEEKEDKKSFRAHITSLEETFHALVYYAKNENNEFVPQFHKDSDRRILKLGKKPIDLLDVLVDMAIASPANCIYRSYKRELCSSASQLVKMETYAPLCSNIALNFLSLMNSQEAMATIDLCYRKFEFRYWKNILNYSKDGNLQAVFDEYVHLLSNGLSKNDKKRINTIHDRFSESLHLITASYDVDTFENFKSNVIYDGNESMYLRTHFAVSFTKGAGNKKDTNRKTSVRDAFNSPFRPFVLTSTSIGQEGLDFHNYCRRIVHWNLPSNPIDLEQREGRINRFACLAIRQNISKRYGDAPFKNNIWIEMFDKAIENEKTEGVSDLIPFWGLRDPKDLDCPEKKCEMIQIERILPMYPFSIDQERYERLIKILSVYRLALGQPRQEEVLEHILNGREPPENLRELFINLSPYYKDHPILDDC